MLGFGSRQSSFKAPAYCQMRSHLSPRTQEMRVRAGAYLIACLLGLEVTLVANVALGRPPPVFSLTPCSVPLGNGDGGP